MIRITNSIKKSLILFLAGLMFPVFSIWGQRSGDFPARPVPPRAVNDYAGFLPSAEVAQLEQKLDVFTQKTSTAIVIAVVPDLHGYDPSDYAFRLGEQWGVGQKGKNNGILILVKPKTAGSKGEVFIATGYGAEGAVPDATARQIVDNEIIPRFKEGKYFEGLDAAVNTLIDLIKGEYTADDYARRTGAKEAGSVVVIILVIVFAILFSLIGKSRSARHYSIGKTGIPWWLWLTMMNSGRGSRGGNWGSFNSGSGMFGGGGGGGFGGFGGGSFGGGGAGGSW